MGFWRNLGLWVCWVGAEGWTRSWSSNLCGADVVPNSFISFGDNVLALPPNYQTFLSVWDSNIAFAICMRHNHASILLFTGRRHVVPSSHVAFTSLTTSLHSMVAVPVIGSAQLLLLLIFSRGKISYRQMLPPISYIVLQDSLVIQQYASTRGLIVVSGQVIPRFLLCSDNLEISETMSTVHHF